MTKPRINPVVWNTFRTLVVWSPLWLATTILFSAVGIGYVLFLKKDTWLASQSIVVREDANRALFRQSRVDAETETKAAQETFVELAKNHQVVKNALKTVGPIPTLLGAPKNWPTPKDVQETIDDVISIHAPRGIDFGKTDVIYLDVKQSTPERAIELNKVICAALQKHMSELRRGIAGAIVTELKRARDVGRAELDKANQKLQEVELKAGSDLTDLRGLIERGGSFSSRALHDQLVGEIRQAELGHHQLASDLNQLESASKDPASFLTAPSSLFASQPGLIRLREGLVDAQIEVSQLAGKLTDDHPNMLAARRSLDGIILRLNEEFQASLASARQAFQVSQDRLTRLTEQKSSLESRLNELAEKRSAYESLLADVETRSTIVQDAERRLSDAEANLAVSENSSCFTLLDDPVISDRPIGPGRKTIIIASVASGMLFGIGLVFLIAPVDVSQKFGRRAIDSLGASQVPIAIVPAQIPTHVPTKAATTESTPQPVVNHVPFTASELIAMAQKSTTNSDNTNSAPDATISECGIMDSLYPKSTSTLKASTHGESKKAISDGAKQGETVQKSAQSEATSPSDAVESNSPLTVPFYPTTIDQGSVPFSSKLTVSVSASSAKSERLVQASMVATEPDSKLTDSTEVPHTKPLSEIVSELDMNVPDVKSGDKESSKDSNQQSSDRRTRPRKATPAPVPTLNFGIRPTDTPNTRN
jgi:polysaccharide biosynthesis transport protein